MTTPFRRTRIADRRRRRRARARRRPGVRHRLRAATSRARAALGNAFAGGAAFADDVTAMWCNPAGCRSSSDRRSRRRLQRHHAVDQVQQRRLAAGGQPAARRRRRRRRRLQLRAEPVRRRCRSTTQWTFGLGVNVPFGLETEYDDGWLGRYQALKSEIKTINVNPAMSWKVTPTARGRRRRQLPAHQGDADAATSTIRARCSQAAAGRRPASPADPPTVQRDRAADRRARFQGDDHRRRRRVGLERRRRVGRDAAAARRRGLPLGDQVQRQRATSTSTIRRVTLPPGTPPQLAGTIAALVGGRQQPGAVRTAASRSDIKLPQIANLSFLYQLDRQWDVMADVQWTGWSSIPELHVHARPTAPALDRGAAQLGRHVASSRSARATGTTTSGSSAFGVAFDQTPVNDTNPTVRLPDSDRWWLAVGGEYRWTPNWKFDVGFVYIFADSPSFNQNQGSTAAQRPDQRHRTTRASWILSVQVTYTF